MGIFILLLIIVLSVIAGILIGISVIVWYINRKIKSDGYCKLWDGCFVVTRKTGERIKGDNQPN